MIENVRVSPDGQWLYYDSNLPGSANVFRMRLPHGDPEQLTTDSVDDFAPGVSPDGRSVVFHSWRSGSRDIYVLPLDGGPVQQVTHSPRQEFLPVWSPDGKRIAFGDLAGSGIWIVGRKADGGWAEPVLRFAGGYWPEWSPDGKRIAFVGGPQGGPLAVGGSDSGAPRTLSDPAVPGGREAEEVQWSADGKMIYFKSHDASGTGAIWRMPADSGPQELVVRFDDPTRPSSRPEWSMGHGRMYYTTENRQADVWVMEVGGR